MINEITSKRIDSPITPTLEESTWEMALESKISLRPLRARKNPLTQLAIRSVHNKNKIAIKIKWEDPTADSIINNNYIDQSAIQFAVDDSDIEDSPFYGMGEKGKIVNIWHWKADVRQKIIKNDKSRQKKNSENSELVSKTVCESIHRIFCGRNEFKGDWCVNCSTTCGSKGGGKRVLA